jgi:hypothetical protein
MDEETILVYCCPSNLSLVSYPPTPLDKLYVDGQMCDSFIFYLHQGAL